MVEDEAMLVAQRDLIMPDESRLHGYGSQMAFAGRIVEGLLEECLMRFERTVRVNNQVPVGTHHRGMRMGERPQREHQVGKPLHRDVSRKHAHQLTLFVVERHTIGCDDGGLAVLLVDIGVNPDWPLLVQGREVPFLPGIKMAPTIQRYINLSRIIVVAVGIHLVVDTILRIDTGLEGDDTTFHVRVLFQELSAEAVQDLRTVQALLDSPMKASRGRLHLVQRVVDAKFRRTQRLARFLHRLQIYRLARMMEHDKEGGNEEYRHESNYPQNDLCGQRMACLFFRKSLHRVQIYDNFSRLSSRKPLFLFFAHKRHFSLLSY